MSTQPQQDNQSRGLLPWILGTVAVCGLLIFGDWYFINHLPPHTPEETNQIEVAWITPALPEQEFSAPLLLQVDAHPTNGRYPAPDGDPLITYVEFTFTWSGKVTSCRDEYPGTHVYTCVLDPVTLGIPANTPISVNVAAYNEPGNYRHIAGGVRTLIYKP